MNNSFIPWYVSAKTRLQWSQVLWIGLFWCVTSVLLALYKSVDYEPTTDQFIFAAPKGYSIIRFLLIHLIGPVTAGLLVAPLIVFVLKEKLRTRSYLTFIGVMGLAFFVIILLLNTAVSSIFLYQPGDSGFSLKGFFNFFLMDPYAIRNILTWMLVGFVTIIMLQISDKYGPGVFSKILIGRYYHPREEERIFMFLDLNDSTHLAEKLGNLQFFKLLNAFITDVTDSILDCRGEVYQYVGDEIVVSWTIRNGLSNANCLRCFFDIERALESKAATYQLSFGIVPKFKAGIHLGQVIIGEIGIIKKDIVYSGDVLNTTSRILNQCTIFREKLIVTQTLTDRLGADGRQFNFHGLGPVNLRGKDTSIELWAVSKEIF